MTAAAIGSSLCKLVCFTKAAFAAAHPSPYYPKDTNLSLLPCLNERCVNNRIALQMLRMEITGISLTRLIILREIMDFKWNSSRPRRVVIIHDQTSKWNQNPGNMQRANFLHQWNLSSSYWLIPTVVWFFNRLSFVCFPKTSEWQWFKYYNFLVF